jgi:hypothetical protein
MKESKKMELGKIINDIKPDKTYKGLPLEDAEIKEVEELILEKYEAFKKGIVK